jgi:hypothetical protein
MNADAIFDAVKQFLNEAHIGFLSAPIPDGWSVYCPSLSAPNRLQTISQTIETWESCLILYAHCLINTPTERIDEMAKFVAMANFNLLPGNFDLDVGTGEVRYRLFLDCRSFETFPANYLMRFLPLPILMLHQYGDAIVAVADGESDAETALAHVDHNAR